MLYYCRLQTTAKKNNDCIKFSIDRIADYHVKCGQTRLVDFILRQLTTQKPVELYFNISFGISCAANTLYTSTCTSTLLHFLYLIRLCDIKKTTTHKLLLGSRIFWTDLGTVSKWEIKYMLLNVEQRRAMSGAEVYMQQIQFTMPNSITLNDKNQWWNALN